MTDDDIRAAAKNIEQRFLGNDVIAPTRSDNKIYRLEDNVAIALCTYLDDRSDCPEQDIDYDRGWKPWVTDAVDELARKLRSIAEQEIRKILNKSKQEITHSVGLGVALHQELAESNVESSLSKSLDRASKNVQSWPQWKQQAAGANLYSSQKQRPAPKIARTARVIERKCGDGTNSSPYYWRRLDMGHLERGDIFRVFDLDAEGNLHIAKTDAGNKEARVVENPSIDPKYGVWSVVYEEVE